MTDLIVTKKLTDLQTVFNSACNFYFRKEEIKGSDLGESALKMDMELPILSDGVNFDTGEPDVTEIKLTTQRIWSRKVQRGDSDISLQIASIEGSVNELLMKKVEDATSAQGLVEGKTYKGAGYSLDPQTITGSLVVVSEDQNAIVILPWMQLVSSLNLADGDNPAYFSAKVTPMANTEGVDLFILTA